MLLKKEVSKRKINKKIKTLIRVKLTKEGSYELSYKTTTYYKDLTKKFP